MGVASYRRGSALITRDFARDAYAKGWSSHDPDAIQAPVTPRPSDWGSKSDARAMDHARRMVAGSRRYGREVDAAILTLAVSEKAKVSPERASAAVQIVLNENSVGTTQMNPLRRNRAANEEPVSRAEATAIAAQLEAEAEPWAWGASHNGGSARAHLYYGLGAAARQWEHAFSIHGVDKLGLRRAKACMARLPELRAAAQAEVADIARLRAKFAQRANPVAAPVPTAGGWRVAYNWWSGPWRDQPAAYQKPHRPDVAQNQRGSWSIAGSQTSTTYQTAQAAMEAADRGVGRRQNPSGSITAALNVPQKTSRGATIEWTSRHSGIHNENLIGHRIGRRGKALAGYVCARILSDGRIGPILDQLGGIV